MKSIVSKPLFALLFLAMFILPTYACMWDRDTLEAEAKGIPDTIRVITGRFERNPDLFYRMRLSRIETELRSSPDKLELYDDAGVASDRLHRGDEAIAWMQKKQAQMAKIQNSSEPALLKEHRYRTLANLGTFIAHRWLRSGADRKKISEMKRARDLIAAAIKINPDAHFGREKYQLKVMQWIINPPKKRQDDYPSIPSFINDGLSEKEAAATIKGLSGLIVLGDAWQSVDVFHALGKALQADEKAMPSYMARLRTCQLVDDKRKSVLPDTPTGEELKELLIVKGSPEYAIPQENIPALEKKFKELRAEADQWHAQRTAYMTERLKTGRHPDTDQTFWNEWQEPPAPSLYVPNARDELYRNLRIGLAVVGILLVSSIALITLRIIKKRNR